RPWVRTRPAVGAPSGAWRSPRTVPDPLIGENRASAARSSTIGLHHTQFGGAAPRDVTVSEAAYGVGGGAPPDRLRRINPTPARARARIPRTSAPYPTRESVLTASTAAGRTMTVPVIPTQESPTL